LSVAAFPDPGIVARVEQARLLARGQ
jgi:hypothetical protein